MDPRDFENSSAGRLIRVGLGEAAYLAFVPNPLPPIVPADWEIAGLLSEADRALSRLAGMGRNLPNPDLFVAPFIRREAVLSSRIEGTRSDITDLYFYEAGQMPLPGFERPASSEADIQEVLNYVYALEYGLNRLVDLPISLRLVKEIHAHLMHKVRGEHATPGEFRARQNWIGGRVLNEAIFIPPPVTEMQIALADLERYWHTVDIYPPLVRLAFIHYQFEAIHPFVDGNGRMGRLLLSLLLVAWNLLPLPLLYLSAYFEHHRQGYYELLMGVSQKGNWREWLNFFLHAVTEQALDTIERVKRIQDLQLAWRTQLQHERATGLTLSVVDLLFESPVLNANRIVERCQVSHQAAMQILRRLEALDIVRENTKRKRNRLYIAPSIVEIVQ